MKKIVIGMLIASIFLIACSSKPKDEKQAFIGATIEATCKIFQAENILDPALEAEARAVYKKFGFDADDETVMLDLQSKYSDLEDVQLAIADGIKACAGDKLEELSSLLGSATDEDADLSVDTTADVDVDVLPAK